MGIQGQVSSCEYVKISSLDVLSHICGPNNANIAVMEDMFKMPIFLAEQGLEYITNSSVKKKDFENLCKNLETSVNHSTDITPSYISLVYYQLFGKQTQKNTDLGDNLDKEKVQKENIEDKTREKPAENSFSSIYVPMAKKQIFARSKGQEKVVESLKTHNLSFLVGPAGTGKTFLATAYAVSLLLQKKVKKYIVTRPVVEAGEKLGFLPGDLVQKVLPYLRPVYDALEEICGESIVSYFQEKNQIEIAPLAYMRGRTLHNSVVLLDEAQNCSIAQMKMFLTRIGEDSKIIVNGDLQQSDLWNEKNGLQHAIEVFHKVAQTSIVQLGESDIQRSKLAKIVVQAYQKAQKNK